MAQRTGHAQQPSDKRQAAVTEHRGGVDARVQETVDGAKAAVEEVLECVHVALKDTVEGVKTTVERIEPAHIQQNHWIIVKATAELIDTAHMHHNPWILMGSAILMGYLLGTLERHTAPSPGPGESSAGVPTPS